MRRYEKKLEFGRYCTIITTINRKRAIPAHLSLYKRGYGTLKRTMFFNKDRE